MTQRDFFKRPDAPIILRPFQADAVQAVYAHLRTRDDNPCVVIPTGGGKTPVMAQICADCVTHWQGRSLILAHVKELLEQSADKLRRVCPRVPIGVYSAGLNRRDLRQPVIVAGIQSVYKRACDFDAFDLIHVDEAQLIQPEGDGMYRQFLADAKQINPNVRVIGYTATPFRMKSGLICAPDGILNHVCYEIGVRELIVAGYLSPLVTKQGGVIVDTSGLRTVGGEFVASQVEEIFDVPEIVQEACREIVAKTAERKSCLIFATGVQHAEHVATAVRQLGQECEVITGETPDAQRARTLERFQRGALKYLANVNVLTTGFDATNIDCVALLRPTNSPGLYYQMVGRGFRLHPGKADCLVLDYGGNVKRHGPVDRIEVADKSGRKSGGEAPAKECPNCQSLIAAGFAVCPDCGHEFPPPQSSAHDSRATDAGILSGQVTDTLYQVGQVFYSVHTKRDAAEDAPRTLRVDYYVDGGMNRKSEWVCLEHDGFARGKAEKWWLARSPDPIPDTIEEAVDIADGGGLCETLEIVVRTVAGEKFDRIIDYKLGPKPEALAATPERAERQTETWEATPYDDDDIPF